MQSVLVLDPGESTGWCFLSENGGLTGGTVPKDHFKVYSLINNLMPDVVVMETFNLYPSMAKQLSWNSFYPCEVIGVIKLACVQLHIQRVDQAPMVKKYAGALDSWWTAFRETCNCTEHTKDTYQHLRYFMRNNALGKECHINSVYLISQQPF